MKQVGYLTVQTGDGITTLANEVTEVYLCSVCAALTAAPESHLRWHRVNSIGLG